MIIVQVVAVIYVLMVATFSAFALSVAAVQRVRPTISLSPTGLIAIMTAATITAVTTLVEVIF